MIEVKVVFDESQIELNGFTISESQDGKLWFIHDGDFERIDQFEMLEQAIKHCMEN